MGTPYLSEIRIFSFNFAPKGWAMCNGQLLPINQNQALFALIGTTFGGDGQVNFALPDLRGRVPLHAGSGFIRGERGGAQAHTLNISEMPAHNHIPNGSSATASSLTAGGNLWANGNEPAYTATPTTPLDPNSVLPVGGNQPHENMSPYLVLNFCIALVGIFPA